jgi:hypothetical protein
VGLGVKITRRWKHNSRKPNSSSSNNKVHNSHSCHKIKRSSSSNITWHLPRRRQQQEGVEEEEVQGEEPGEVGQDKGSPSLASKLRFPGIHSFREASLPNS